MMGCEKTKAKVAGRVQRQSLPSLSPPERPWTLCTPEVGKERKLRPGLDQELWVPDVLDVGFYTDTKKTRKST